MTDSEPPSSPMAAAAGPRASDAFSILGNETRLSILLALWEAYEPFGEENAVSFSDLRESVGVRDSGQFNYHLDQLTDQFVRSTEDGYRLRESGQKLVRTVIAGTGIGETSREPTPLDVPCNRCGSHPVHLSYTEETLYLTCTACKGFITDDEFPRGTLAVWHLDPAGVNDRSPPELFVASAIAENNRVRMMLAGVCPDCSGTVSRSVTICTEHAPAEGKVCPDCGTRDSVRVRYVCTVCKNWNAGPVQVTVHDHPVVIAFYYDHGIDLAYDIDDVEGFYDVWEYLWGQDHELVSTDPVEIRVTIPCEDEELHLTLDEELTVVDVKRC